MSPQPDNKADSPRGVFVQRQSMNIYTVLLILALVALIVACSFLAAELSRYEWQTKGPVSQLDLTIPAAQAGIAPAAASTELLC